MSDQSIPDHTQYDDGPGWEPAPSVPPAPDPAVDPVPEAEVGARPFANSSTPLASPNADAPASSEVPYPKATVEQPDPAPEPEVQIVTPDSKESPPRVELVDDDTGFSHTLPQRQRVRTPWS